MAAAASRITTIACPAGWSTASHSGEPTAAKALSSGAPGVRVGTDRTNGSDRPVLLAQLATLYRQGVLTDEEFQQKKAKLLTKI